jgi:hypothetical protein
VKNIRKILARIQNKISRTGGINEEQVDKILDRASQNDEISLQELTCIRAAIWTGIEYTIVSMRRGCGSNPAKGMKFGKIARAISAEDKQAEKIIASMQ